MSQQLLEKFPVPLNEPARLKALRDHEILDSLSEYEFDRITELASIICDVPISLVSLVDEKRQWFKSHRGLDVTETSRDLAFCQYAIMDSAIFEIEDATKDERFHDNLLVTGNPHIRFYAGCPLIDAQGYALGTLCVIDRKPKLLSTAQKRALQLLSEEATSLIAERMKKAELKNFEKLFDFSDDLMFVGNNEGFFQRINPSFERLLGWSNQHLLNTSTFDFLHPDDIKATQAELDKLTEGVHCINFVQRFKTSTGTYKTIQWTSTPETSTGKIYGIGRDITEQALVEEELKQTKEMLEQTNQVARVGGWSFDVAQQKIYWTSVTKEIHGVEPDFTPDLHTGINFYKAGESRDKIKTALDTAFAEGSSWNLELQIINSTGNEIWVRALGHAQFENGKCKRLFGTFQDINDYKQAELALKEAIDTEELLNQVLIRQIALVKEQDQTIDKIKEFKFLADSIPQIVWTADADGSTDYFNRYWFDYTGLSLDGSTGFGWETILHPDDENRTIEVWAEAVRSGNPYEIEYRFKRASDGLYKWFLGRGLPMKNEAGEIVKWFGSCTDIDEYKRALDLENKISQYEDFNRIVAHNLRGPAGSIQMIISMINNTDTDEQERKELLTMLEQSSITLNETLNELMKVLEVRNNHDLHYDDCDLKEIVAGVERMLAGQIIAKKANIITSFKAPSIKFPRLYLESIFYNMVSNALKYSKPDVPPQIIISAETNKEKVALRFKDNGLGIDLEKHGSNMFKLNQVFHSGFDSKGVGLFMTKTQIETFGGHIRVESEPNIGSEFILEL